MTRVLVIGGGPAGSATAIAAAAGGVDVTLVERAAFPRDKVCGGCLSTAGLAALDELGVASEFRSLSASVDRWIGHLDGRRVELDLPPGRAVSRKRLDPLLLERAAAVGVTVRTETEARIVAMNDDAAVVDVGGVRETYDVVVAATGLGGGSLTRYLPWIDPPHGPYGLFAAVDAAACPELETGVIDMRWNDDGYVGLVHLGDGRVDIAAAVEPSASGRPAEILERMTGVAIDPSTILATPPLRRTRTPAAGRLIAVGDAAGYVEPFTGEGMTWAMRSGIAAGRLIATAPPRGLAERWTRTASAINRTRRIRCAAVTSTLRRPMLRRFIGRSLGRFPGLASPLVSRL